MSWLIDFEGEVYREGDLTLGLIARIDAKLRSLGFPESRWAGVLNSPNQSPAHFVAFVAMMASDRLGENVDVLTERLEAFHWSDFTAAFKDDKPDDMPTEYVDGVPPEADEPEMTS